MASKRRYRKVIRSTSHLSSQSLRKIFFRPTTGEVSDGGCGTGNAVEIIRSISDLNNNDNGGDDDGFRSGGTSKSNNRVSQSVSLEDVRLWSRLGDSFGKPGPNRCTTNLAWLVGTTERPNKRSNYNHNSWTTEMSSSSSLIRHVDVVDIENSRPPSHLNVKDVVQVASGSESNFPLSQRSKSVHDLSYVNLCCDDTLSDISPYRWDTASGASSVNTNTAARRKRSLGGSNVAKNSITGGKNSIDKPTALGNLPLFHKFSLQSLTSVSGVKAFGSSTAPVDSSLPSFNSPR